MSNPENPTGDPGDPGDAVPPLAPPPRPDLPDVAPLTAADALDAQGWYFDPFQAHEARWFSAGHPTALVRDAGVEAHDEPPEDHWDGPLELVHDDEGFQPDEMSRAENPPHQRNAIDGSGSLGIGFT